MSRTCTIVGMHFVPPAKFVIEALPAGSPLTVQHDPANAYSTFAVKVFCRPADIVWDPEGSLEMKVIGCGQDKQALLQQPLLMLGHIGENKVPDGLFTSKDVTAWLENGEELVGALSFDPAGKPLCVFPDPE